MARAASEFLQVFQTPPPTYSQQYALQILERQFGCRGQLKVLGSERDQNFLVTTDKGDKRLLKFSNYSEDPGITNFQTAAFLHVEKADPEMIVSRVLPALDRTYEVRIHGGDGNDSTVRLFSWIDGVAMIDVPESKRPGNPEVMGGRLARMASALEGFEHASMGYELAYDVSNMYQHDWNSTPAVGFWCAQSPTMRRRFDLRRRHPVMLNSATSRRESAEAVSSFFWIGPKSELSESS